MNKRLIISILLTTALAACSSKAVKPSTTPPPVVDKSTSSQKTPPARTPSANDDGSASTAPMTESNLSSNALTDPNNILSKRSVFFDYDSDEVKSEYRPLVEAHAKYLVAHPNAKLTIQGNTDERGTREYNLSLGQRRAVAVKKVMNVLGAQDKQIETVSYGEEKANACADESCYKQNRHADISYSGE